MRMLNALSIQSSMDVLDRIAAILWLKVNRPF
jgi:hypothetical protein